LPLRRILCVVAPLAGLAAAATLAPGASWTATFLGQDIILARRDGLSDIFGLVFSVASLLANIYGWYRSRASEQIAALLYAGGGLAVVFSGDLVSMLVAWEIMAVASAVLVFAGGARDSTAAGQRYLMVHLAAGALLLVGVLIVVTTGGATTFGALAASEWGGGLILLAFCINAAGPPLHAWLPDAYPRATVSGSVFLSTFTTKAAVYCLLRGFAGTEVLIPLGAVMAFYGVVFAVMENDMRRLLSYHIVSQVGYMVCGVGVGTAMALNGAVAHAVCHILYKGLLFMAVGAVVYRTGRGRLSDLGGLRSTMPLTLVFYMVGALSISGAPLFNGFVSKSLVLSGVAADHRAFAALLLNLAGVGTFLSVALKLPFFAWGPGRREVRSVEAPLPMLVAMAAAAAACVLLGIAPGWLYARLPFGAVDYDPFTAAHIYESLLMMAGAALAFVQLRRRLEPHPLRSLDCDQPYRIAAVWLSERASLAIERGAARLGAAVAAGRDAVAAAARNPALAMWRALRAESAAEITPFDADQARPPVGSSIGWLFAVFVLLASLLIAAVGP
jgi:multicomponent Na+:H+ antiporter subunit D